MTCNHEFHERESAVGDGMCPLCLSAENAELRELVKPIALVPLWRDTYHDGPDVIIGREAGYFNPDQVRKARAILAKEPAP